MASKPVPQLQDQLNLTVDALCQLLFGETPAGDYAALCLQGNCTLWVQTSETSHAGWTQSRLLCFLSCHAHSVL